MYLYGNKLGLLEYFVAQVGLKFCQKILLFCIFLQNLVGQQKWVHFFGPVNGKTKVDSFIGYAAHLGLIRGGTPSGLYC